MNTKVLDYITAKNKWTQELKLLRSVLLELSLEETIKWGAPVYVYKNKNIVGLSAFKNYCGLWFFQGMFLNDDKKVLKNAQEEKTHAMRQWQFCALNKIDVVLVKEYVLEAIKNSENGKEFKPIKNTKPLIIPTELQMALDDDDALRACFANFSLSKKREYANYISEAKRETTKYKRLDKITPMILKGMGLHDKYKNC
ncbi:YdeI/OmpD-associated family protein [Tenacibaculum sp. HL-MS23]|uniref:YdeI/OmpD-associated family protein n=1 Tax=Tenacibaculum sp. HL-MS23 TaxID=3077734 RepID=UPI0028FC0E08|nr:DUF1801 domain-containing protein [Tenacibaculum sp. HL-MS23]WNW02328.1 YdeI/OmpD-associated family protein [Tenacibaculum sp. HL-MS23]